MIKSTSKRVTYICLKNSYRLIGKAAGKLARIPLLYEIFHILARYAMADTNGMLRVEMHGHKMYITSNDIGFFMLGEYEPKTTKVFLSLIHEGDIVVDVGAQIGRYTLLAAKVVGNNGKVFAFEPDPENYGLLVKNIKLSGYTNVVPIQKAVSNKTGIAKLFLRGSFTHSLFADDHTSVLRRAIPVSTISLDDFFQTGRSSKSRIRLIKMDVEGAEMLVLLGMSRLITDNRPLVIISEFNPELLKSSGCKPEEFLTRLTEYGFKLRVIEGVMEAIDNLEPTKILGKIKPRSGVNLLCTRMEILLSD